jgi:hypothetical protein
MLKKHRKQVNYLDMVPVRNVQEFKEEEGKVTLLVPKFRHAWMLRWLVPAKRSRHFRIHLDEMGSRVWRLIDGRKNTGQICDALGIADEAGGQADNLIELRVTKFLSQLYKSRFITFREEARSESQPAADL